MRQRQVGSTGLRVSRLGLGTMTWGTDTDEHDAEDQLRAFVDAGGTLVDTAASYASGASEALLGQILDRVVGRDDVVVATTAGVCWRAGERVVDGSRSTLLRDLDQSLARLGVDHVDLWQAHGWSADVPLDETLSALEHAVDTGRARYVGVCNFAGWQLAQAATRLHASGGRSRLASAQVEYSLLERGVERELAPAAAALGVGLLPWSPLGRGVLTGKYRGGTPADSRAASPDLARFVGAHLNPGAARVVEAVCAAADGLGLSPLDVALAWVRDRPGVAAPVVGARTAGQLAASLAVEEVTLPAEIVRALDDVSAPPMGYPER